MRLLNPLSRLFSLLLMLLLGTAVMPTVAASFGMSVCQTAHPTTPALTVVRLAAPGLVPASGDSLPSGNLIPAGLAVMNSSDDNAIALDKRLRYDDLAAAASELTAKTLMPPVMLATKKSEIMAKLGKPKETDGYGTELYKLSDATVTLSYTTDDQGEVIVSGVEFRPKKAISWNNWVQPSVTLPSPPSLDKKRKPVVQLTTQIRIADIGNRRSMQVTLIGNADAVSFANWSLVF